MAEKSKEKKSAKRAAIAMALKGAEEAAPKHRSATEIRGKLYGSKKEKK